MYVTPGDAIWIVLVAIFALQSGKLIAERDKFLRTLGIFCALVTVGLACAPFFWIR
jgi:hypothetical protein